MKLFPKRQTKSEIISDCSRIILEIKEIISWEDGDLAAHLGVDKRTIYNAEKKVSGSEQLLAALWWLKSAVENDNKPPPETLEQKVARLEERLNRLDKFGGRVTYGEHQALHSAMNEKPEKPPVGEKNPPQLPPLTPKPTADVIRRARELGDAPGEGHTQAANE